MKYIKKFFELCKKANKEISEEEEFQRYKNPPYNSRISKWVDWRFNSKENED